jgi:hypothetical protein
MLQLPLRMGLGAVAIQVLGMGPHLGSANDATSACMVALPFIALFVLDESSLTLAAAGALSDFTS